MALANIEFTKNRRGARLLLPYYASAFGVLMLRRAVPIWTRSEFAVTVRRRPQQALRERLSARPIDRS